MTLTLHADPIPLRVDRSGTVRVGTSLVTLDTLIERFHGGETPEALAESFAPLPLADIYSVIGYYLRHQTEVDAYLKQRAREADELRAQHPELFPDGTAVRQLLQARRARSGASTMEQDADFPS